MAQYSHLSTPDPELPSNSGPLTRGPLTAEVVVPALRQTLKDAQRRRWERFQARPPVLDSAYTVADHTMVIDGGATIGIRTISPTPTGDEGPDIAFPVLVYLHGGGWVAGNIGTNDLDLRVLSVELRLAIVNLAYRLAPEHPFPNGLNDCYAALKWTVEKHKTIRGSLVKGFVVGGIAAGANFAAAVTHRALKDPFFNEHRLTGHWLQLPPLIHPAAYPPEYASELLSREQNADAPILSKASLDLFYDCLAGPPSDHDISPILGDHSGLPPVYMQICGLDPLRDEGFLYEPRYPGVPHGFHVFLPPMGATKKWHTDLREGLKWILGETQAI
ncbi:Alpha/Beta hydrolase protein [Mycena galopus ATCC 62051]|nr:Alpha/Beta hydrolase protein [Mycena galopus ATCC 62051]